MDIFLSESNTISLYEKKVITFEMKLCSIDTTLNEKVSAKKIIGSINPEIAKVKFRIIKKVGSGLDRKTLEQSHVLFITLPTKKLTQEQYIELISYIDIGGCLFFTLPSPPWTDLGRFFNEFIQELGISFEERFVYGLPKIPLETKLLGTELKLTKAHIIRYNNNDKFLKETGIKRRIPLALMDSNPVILANYKRRGRFVIFSSPEIFTKKNMNFLSRLVNLSAYKKDYLIEIKGSKKVLEGTNYSLQLEHAMLDTYLLSLFHHKFRFYNDAIKFTSLQSLINFVYNILSNQKLLGPIPSKEEIRKAISSFQLGDEKC